MQGRSFLYPWQACKVCIIQCIVVVKDREPTPHVTAVTRELVPLVLTLWGPRKVRIN